MKFPTQHTLDCPPYGKQIVTVSLMDDDPEFIVADDVAATAHDEVISQWKSVWGATHPKIEKILKEYEYGKTLKELLSDPKNSLNVLIMSPDEEEAFRLDVFVDVGFKMGSHVFGVEFEELTPLEATATF
ncbi:MAG: hypothetical protein ACSHYA_13485 [Opitutaceae bacterium]